MPYQILVEEQRSRGQNFALNTEVLPELYSSPESAHRAAHRLAYDHIPRHPHSLKSRTVFRAAPGHYIVRTQGMTGEFGFTVRVCERLQDTG